MTIKLLKKITKKDNFNCYYLNAVVFFNRFSDAPNCSFFLKTLLINAKLFKLNPKTN